MIQRFRSNGQNSIVHSPSRAGRLHDEIQELQSMFGASVTLLYTSKEAQGQLQSLLVLAAEG
jgi:hypothetical protein